MNIQYDTLATSSFLEYLDNRICSIGGYYNVSSLAYPIKQIFAGYSVYAFPYGQIIADTGISGANILSGIYINNSFIQVGTSGLSGINFEKSQIYIDSNYAPPIISVSGNYAIKELNISLANFPDISILFETKLALRSKIPMQPTGLNNNILTYPVIFIENASAQTNTPWQIGGVDQTRSTFNLYCFCESLYQKNNLITLCKDMAWKYIPLLTPNDMSFNNLGYYKDNIPYNYTDLTKNFITSGKAMIVEDCTFTEFGNRGLLADIQRLTTDAYFALISVTCWTSRVTP